MMGAASHVHQELSRLSTTLPRARRVRLASILMSRGHHHAHLGVALASIRPPRGNLPSSPAPASPVLATSTPPTVASRSTTARARPDSSVQQVVRALPVPRARTRLLRVPPPDAPSALLRVRGRRHGVSRPTTVWQSPHQPSRRCVQRYPFIISMNHGFSTAEPLTRGTTCSRRSWNRSRRNGEEKGQGREKDVNLFALLGIG